MKKSRIGILFLTVVAVAGINTASAEVFKEELRLIETSGQFAATIAEKHPGLLKPVTTFATADNESALALVPKDALPLISEEWHQLTNRCGGFIDITHESNQALLGVDAKPAQKYALPALNGRKQAIVDALKEIRPDNIRDFVNLYSGAFKTRNARTPEGQKAPIWLADKWREMALRHDPKTKITVETLSPPSGYNQPNVRITIPGSDPSLPIVIMGGHLDSINGRGGDAPGADDDASGISALTEAYRVILVSNLKPKATIHIFGYAAEELGLLGSRTLAELYQRQGVKVRGALQLDMVAFPGANGKVTFIVDHIDRELTTWTQQIFGLYDGGEIQEDRCGYACSDHASWTRYRFASVFPFEAITNQMNSRIHSTRDLWDTQLDAEYAARFAKTAYAFAAELSEAQ